MQLHLTTWPEVEEYLTRSRGVIVPIGSTEQHGPTGLIGTDALCAENIARGVGAAAQALVTPTISVGMAVHHMGFAGTLTLRPTTLISVIQDYVTSLAEHGFERIFFLNGHGGNIPTIESAFYETYAALQARGKSGVRCRLLNWWNNDHTQALWRSLYGDSEGLHATPSEVAVTQHLFPDHIKRAPLDPPTAPGGRFYDTADYRRRFPDGRVGSNPGLATPEHGRQFYEGAVAAIADIYAGFLNEA